MSVANFERAFRIVVGEEGGYVNDPRDPGGRTKFGISQRSYPSIDIASLTLAQARAIYHRDYWSRVRCDDLPWAFALCAFDSAVNQGPRVAVTMMQDALGVTPDGVIGQRTLAAVQSANDRHLARYFMKRVMRYMRTDNFDRFGEGWVTRCFVVHREACT